MHSRIVLFLATIALSLVVCSAPTRGCQMSCEIYGSSGTRGVLFDNGDDQGKQRPIPNAKLIVRDASPSAKGPQAFCGRKGPIVLTTSTDKHGNFNLKGIHPGTYYITYMDTKDGQSFLVQIGRSDAANKRLELSLFIPGGLCYAEDIERNVTIPDWGGIKPVKEGH